MLSYAEGKVLEVGVGTGLNISHYNKENISELIGIDWSIKMIEEALSKDDENKMKFKMLNAENLPFEDSYFDTVVDTFSI